MAKRTAKKIAARIARTELAAKVTVKVDRALKERFAAELARFDQAKSGEVSGWDEMYEALDAILYSDPPLYLAEGMKTARAFLAKHLPGVSEPLARNNIRVARAFDPEDEQRHGTAKLGPEASAEEQWPQSLDARGPYAPANGSRIRSARQPRRTETAASTSRAR
jgi:hypothetical protein